MSIWISTTIVALVAALIFGGLWWIMVRPKKINPKEINFRGVYSSFSSGHDNTILGELPPITNGEYNVIVGHQAPPLDPNANGNHTEIIYPKIKE